MRTGLEFSQEFEEKRVVEGKRRIRLLSSEQACFRRPDFCRQVILDSKLTHARSMPGIASSQNLPDLLAARADIERIPKHHAVGESGDDCGHSFRFALVLFSNEERHDLGDRVSISKGELQEHHTHRVGLLLGAGLENLDGP